MSMEKLIEQSIELLSEINGETTDSIKTKIASGCKSTENQKDT